MSETTPPQSKRTRVAAATAGTRSAIKSVKAKLPAATRRNVAIGAAAAVTAVGVGVAATVGRKRIAKASGDLIASVKQRVAQARADKDSNGRTLPN